MKEGGRWCGDGVNMEDETRRIFACDSADCQVAEAGAEAEGSGVRTKPVRLHSCPS